MNDKKEILNNEVRVLTKIMAEKVLERDEFYVLMGILFEKLNLLDNIIRNEDEKNIESLDFSLKLYSILKRAGIKKITDLTKYTEKEVKSFKNIEKENFEELKSAMAEFGVNFRED